MDFQIMFAKCPFLIFSQLGFFCAIAQDSTVRENWKAFFYLDAYYSYDFNNPSTHEKTAFLYHYNRHNEVNINLALAKVTFNSGRVRSTFGLMAGTYPEKNLAAEPGLLKHIYEASTGLKLSKKQDLWLDAGIFPSHIGFESAISKDSWTLSRSILAENSPYYEAGIKATYREKKEVWTFSLLLLNGWQRITKLHGNNSMSWGTQIIFQPSEKLLFNHSSFIGNDKPDSNRRNRYFNNLYSIIKIRSGLDLILGFDMGLEKKANGLPGLDSWYSPVCIIRMLVVPNYFLTARGEFYSDKKGVIISPIGLNAVQMFGISANLDHTIGEHVMCRLEGRWLRNKAPYFDTGGILSRSNYSITAALSVNF